MIHFPESHTAANLKIKFDKSLEDIGFDFSQNPKLVTDSASNNVAAFKEYLWLPCMCHKLNTSKSNAWKDLIAKSPEIMCFNQAVNKLVTHVQHKSDIQKKLIMKIKPGSKTRAWRGLIDKFSKVYVNYDRLNEILTDKTFINAINRSLLEKVISLLEPLKSTFDILESSENPTIQRVLPRLQKMKLQFSPNQNDDTLILQVKESFLKGITEKYVPNDIHYVATLLTPSYKKFNFSENAISDMSRAKTLLKKLYSEMNTTEEDTNKIESPKSKYTKIDSDEDESDAEISPVSSFDDEFDAYIKCPKDQDIISFWIKNNTKLPILSKIALQVLVIPASSSLSERIFSVSGYINDKRKCSMKPETLALLTQLKSVSKIFKIL